MREAIDHAEKVWKQFLPHRPFEYSFLSMQYEQLYDAEQKQGQLFILFSGLAIFIASLGLFGGIGHYLFTAAFRHAPASLLAPLNYIQLLWAGVLGWLVFGHVPDAVSLLGMAIVAGSGVLVALKTRRPPAKRSA